MGNSQHKKLIHACGMGDLEEVKRLHASGVDLTAKNNKAIRFAAYWGRDKVVRYLRDNGVDFMSICGDPVYYWIKLEDMRDEIARLKKENTEMRSRPVGVSFENSKYSFVEFD